MGYSLVMTLDTNMNYSVTDCYYADVDHKTIACWLEIPDAEKMFLLLTADAPDSTATFYENALNGDYGPITSYADSHWYCTLHGFYWNNQYYGLGDVMISPSGEQPPNATQTPPPRP
jgi:hypothetical protein